MSSHEQPEKWGYGLTWVIAIGLTVMIGFGAVKLRANAKHGYEEQAKNKIEAEAKA